MKKSAETTFRALLLNLLVAIMEADGIVDEREVQTIGDVYEEIVGFRLEDSARARLITSVAISRPDALALLRARAHLLEPRHRESLVQLAIRMLRSDLMAHPREWTFVHDIAESVGLSDDEIGRLLG